MKTFKAKKLTLALTISAGLVTTLCTNASAAEIVVASWGGAYSQAQTEAMVKPFTAKTGTKVLMADYNGGLAEMRAQVKTGNVKWDVVDVELAEALRGCDEGLFEKIDRSKLPAGADGSPAKDDFYKGLLTTCAVATISYANVYAYDKTKFSTGAPTTLEDFFDLKKFPGKRSLKKSPTVALEWALMADGVPVEKVYEVLSTPAGVDQAFKKLDTIKSSVVWWTAGAQPPQLLASGEVALAAVYHGRIYDAVHKDNKPFAIVWDGQIDTPDLFAVVKGSQNTQAALDFVHSATSTKSLADMTKYLPYSPARKSSMKLVDEKIIPWLPSSPHAGRSMVLNAGWWSDHADELNQRFANWLAK
ncbi:ABC transporter substrate-binding protein [Rhodoferax sp. PAMC 29310]|jgi:putative spermidine/putrescine transport system substrate-binding protein|uniref:ABC transporter substrate-binding protein n=1 Tax=Rhodoferax sp. PAMC 29310 TaxID=2822760 RepID=UPI001B31BC15|nr:ABC transporter substrate-binding protein [Rhodoferax sp. PAMC 29310]